MRQPALTVQVAAGRHIVDFNTDNDMAKPLTQTISMDSVHNERRSKISIQRHCVDWASLAEDVGSRVDRSLRDDPTGCLFFNPAVTVFSPDPSPDFFRVVRKEQARWCRRSSSTFGDKARRSSRNWSGGGDWISNKCARFLDRALSFTGILFIGGRLIQPHNWPKPPSIADRSHHLSQNTR